MFESTAASARQQMACASEELATARARAGLLQDDLQTLQDRVSNRDGRMMENLKHTHTCTHAHTRTRTHRHF